MFNLSRYPRRQRNTVIKISDSFETFLVSKHSSSRGNPNLTIRMATLVLDWTGIVKVESYAINNADCAAISFS